ncbi:hypothetical protein IWX81_001704 [Salinibacterium sp. CAN_S4]|uniref:hypothetical protein n=1 Tax=Salinibacterium sp. CAN_S4 TaxID=2787727 RepID=UPI0018EFD031
MPSDLHELRRGQLDSMLILAGLTIPLNLRWELQPDVARLDPVRPRLGVGDAKSSESPGNQSTQRRLVHYARACRNWRVAGWDVSLSLAVEPSESRPWAETLTRVWRVGGMGNGHVRTFVVDASLAILTIEIGAQAPLNLANRRFSGSATTRPTHPER